MRWLHSLLLLAPLHQQCLVAAENWGWPDGPSPNGPGSFSPDVVMPANGVTTEYAGQESDGLGLNPLNDTNNALDRRAAKDFYLRILPLGASITQGVASSDENGYRKHLRNYLRFKGWKVNMVGSKKNGNMGDNDNEGHPGAVVKEVHGKIAKIANLKPNLVLINAGTNDCNQKRDPKETANNMKAVLDEIYQRWPETTVILSTIVKNKGADACTKALSGEYKELVKTKFKNNRITIADVNDAIQLNQLADGIHPTDEGYKLFAAVWADAFNRVADKIQPPPKDGPDDEKETGGSNTCKKVAGKAKGPFKTQEGSGADDGNYVHKSVDKGSVATLKKQDYFPAGVDGCLTDYIFFANIVQTVANVGREAAHDDLIIAKREKGGPKVKWVYRQNLGGGKFSEDKELDVDPGCGHPNSYAWGDFNNDGLDDFFCISPKAAVSVSLNTGGNPPKFKSIGKVVDESDQKGEDVRLGDIDGDGRVDICFTGKDGVKCTRNGGRGDQHFLQGFLTEGGRRELVVAKSAPANGKVWLGDLNGDYRADVLLIGSDGKVDTHINQRGHGKGIVPAWHSAGTTYAGTPDTAKFIKFARIYGSNKVDYVYLKDTGDNFEVRVAENTGAGGTKRKADGNFYCDMTGSGSDDYVWIEDSGKLNGVFLNIHQPPKWGTKLKIDLTVPGPRMGIHLVDWDGDGKCDVLVQTKASGALTLYRNDWQTGKDTITFTNKGIVAETGCKEGWGVSIFDRGMRLADIDGDKRADAICIESSGRMTAHLNRASGLFNAGQIKFAEGWDRANIRFADVEKSGRKDIIWVDKYTGAGRVWTNNGFKGLGQGGGGSSFNWENRGVLYSGVERGENLHFVNIGGQGRADIHQILDPGANTAQTHMNQCEGGGGGDDGPISDPGLPAYTSQ